MLNVTNATALVAAVASSGLANVLEVFLTIFGAAVGAYLIMDYFHNKHMENLGKQMAETNTVAVQSIQNMVTLAIAAEQGMDITDKVIGKPVSQADKKAQ
jgi:uncharacterized membrane protein YidH (DUF202 family)